MKTIRIYSHALLITLGMSLFFLGSCMKEDNDNNNNSQTYTTSGTASGSQQNPPVNTTGSAMMMGNYNSSTNIWQYSVSWTSLSSAATLVEVRGPATAGVNGNLVFSITITGGGLNGASSNTVTLSEQQEADLLAGRYYFIVANATHITGEVRGQISATAQ